MKPAITIPVVLAAAVAVASGVSLATAQDQQSTSETAGPPNAGKLLKTDTREHGRYDERGERGEHDKRGHSQHEARHDNERDSGGRHGGGSHREGFGGPVMMQKLFGLVDVNKDGSVTQDEIDAYRAEQVANADSNGDGALNIEEFDSIYRAMTRSRMVDIFQDFDADGDGTISPAELDDRFGSVVERMDRNDDGALSIEDRGRGHRS